MKLPTIVEPPLHRYIFPLLALALISANQGAATPIQEATAVELKDLPSAATILPMLTDKRVVFVGEIHDNYSNHLMQLAIIRAFHERQRKLAIGVEFFQQPFQQYVDAYIAGDIDEKTLLRRTEYLQRWRVDYRLYRPIIEYAREHRLPIIALNVPMELTAKVAQVGVAGLAPEERAKLPEMDRSDARYRANLQALYQVHPQQQVGSFETFWEAQLLWDEGMAARAADHLRRHRDTAMVILAGAGHLAYGMGIPQRLERRLPVESAIVLNEPLQGLTPDLADFALFPEPARLPEKGVLGILMQNADKGVQIKAFTDASAAQSAGLQVGDRIVKLDGQPVKDMVDVQLALVDSEVGKEVDLAVLRGGDTKPIPYRFALGQTPQGDHP